MMYHTIEWLIENMGMKVFFGHIVGMYVLKPLLDLGFQLEFTNYYDEYEYMGKKVYAGVKPSKYFLEP